LWLVMFLLSHVCCRVGVGMLCTGDGIPTLETGLMAIQPLRWPTTILVNRMVNLHKPIHPTSLLTLSPVVYHPRDVGCDCGWLCSYFHMYVAVLVWVCCVPETASRCWKHN
jgi:hypothetical protein